MDIDLLSKMIKELILDKDEVSLPGVGAFVAEIVPSTFSDKGYTINPPYRRLYFRQRQDEGDTAIADFYAASNNLDKASAELIINDFLRELKEVLQEKKTIIFPGLGRLRATRENNFFFVADEDLDIYPAGFGLESISLKTHEETPEAVSAAIESLKNIMATPGIAEVPAEVPDTELPTEEPEDVAAEEPEDVAAEEPETVSEPTMEPKTEAATEAVAEAATEAVAEAATEAVAEAIAELAEEPTPEPEVESAIEVTIPEEPTSEVPAEGKVEESFTEEDIVEKPEAEETTAEEPETEMTEEPETEMTEEPETEVEPVPEPVPEATATPEPTPTPETAPTTETTSTPVPTSAPVRFTPTIEEADYYDSSDTEYGPSTLMLVLKAVLWVFIAAAVLLILFVLLAHIAPNLIDHLLYSREELEILRY